MQAEHDLPYRLGVGAMMFNGAGDVFVAKRIDNPGEAWQMPQGGIDEGEDPALAILRELEEETGTANVEILAQTDDWLTYDIPEELRKRLWGGRFRGQKQKWYALRFLGHDDEIDLAAHHDPEFSEWKWTAMNTLSGLIVPFKRPLYEALIGQFADLPEMIRGGGK